MPSSHIIGAGEGAVWEWGKRGGRGAEEEGRSGSEFPNRPKQCRCRQKSHCGALARDLLVTSQNSVAI